MFGWFAPSCPVDLQSKVWVEQRLSWLIQRFGKDRILKAPRVLPTREFFPDPYHGTQEDVAPLFERVCQYMGADSRRFILKLFTEDSQPNVLGLYEQSDSGRPRVKLLKSLLPDQEAVISTLSHEVAHDLLLGAGLLTGNEPDHEQLTDLLPVVLGMGTFHSNTAIKQQNWIEGSMAYSSIQRSGYLTAMVCGYAMGVIEWLRHSTSAPSVAYLGQDAAGSMRSGHRYLLKTGDCLIDRDYPERPIATPTINPLDAGIHGSASRCLYVLQSWLTDHEINQSQIDAALICLQRKEPAIQTTAIEVLERAKAPSGLVIDSVLAHLYSSHHLVRERAAMAVGSLRPPLNYVTKEGQPLLEALQFLTRDQHSETAVASAVVLGTYGSDAIATVPNILPLLVTALSRQSDAVESLFQSLDQIVGNVRLYLHENPSLLSQGHHELIRDSVRGRNHSQQMKQGIREPQ